MALEVQHQTMWGVYRADAEADNGPMAMFWDEEMANDFAAQKNVPDDDRIGADLCVCKCRVEILVWNSFKDPGKGRLERAAVLLGHGDYQEREKLIESEQD